MPRNLNPFTPRQIRFVEAIRNQLCDISDPDSPMITNDDYEWRTETTKEFGKIPKIRFRPFSSRTKADIVTQAGLTNKNREEAIDKIREKYGLKKDQFTKARLFESEWNNLMVKALRAIKTVAYLNAMFATPRQTMSDPLKILQDIALTEFSSLNTQSKKPVYPSKSAQSSETPQNKHFKPYSQLLNELE